MKGITVPILTPFFEDGSINFNEYNRLIEYYIKADIEGLFICGTSGEFANLTLKERKSILKNTEEHPDSKLNIMYNVTATNLEDVTSLIEYAKKNGVDSLSATTPYYHKYSQEALIKYFTYIADSAEGLPLYLYNIPASSGTPISPMVVKRLVESCKNIGGLKDSSMDHGTLLEYQAVTQNSNFEILTGNDAQILTALLANAAGAVVVFAGVFPKECVNIYKSYLQGDLETARKEQFKIMAIRKHVRDIGPITGHKYLLELQGFKMGSPRFPFVDITEEQKKTLADAAMAQGLIKAL